MFMQLCRLPAFFLLLFLLLSGCSKDVHTDYAQYLENNQGEVLFTPVPLAFKYRMTPETQKHTFAVRSIMAGPLTEWNVHFADILNETMASSDIQKALHNLPMTRDFGENCILFHLIFYNFENTKASVRLEITTTLSNGVSFKRSYSADGRAQRGKMYWGSMFAMKNAMQQSTKSAMDSIFKRYTTDLFLFIHKNSR